jgi:hypothetical protein
MVELVEILLNLFIISMLMLIYQHTFSNKLIKDDLIF